MRRKLSGYFLLSLFSFGFFSIVFQTMANAQGTPIRQPLQQSQAAMPTLPIPTPTIYNALPVFSAKALKKQQTKQPLPTPTIYLAQQPTPSIIQASFKISPTAASVPTVTIVPQPTSAGIVDIETLFGKYSTAYNVSENELKKIAKCESGFNTTSDTGTYAGMFQFSEGTWESTRNMMKLDPNPELRKNAKEAIRTAAFMLSQGRENAWPNCH